MRIVFDAHPLTDGQKTGVGYCEAGIISALLKDHPANQYFLEYFSFKNPERKRALLAGYRDRGGILNECAWFPGALYRALWNFLPVPYRLFFGSKGDIIHFFNYHVPPGAGGKKVATIHDMGYKAFPETVRFKTKLMLNLSLRRSGKRADRIITDSLFSKNEIIKYLGIAPQKITVCPCGVDRTVFHPGIEPLLIDAAKSRYGVTGEYFLYLGTLEPRKNIERVIEAYSGLKKEDPSTPLLVIAGRKGWLYASIFEQVSALAMKDHIIFTGYVEDGDKPALLSGATAFVFPSLYEGFGMPPLEAMACGTPVLTSNSSSLPEVTGDAAILVDPCSVEEIKNGMKRLAEDEALRASLSEKGAERASLFSWERSAEIVMDVYRELVEG